MPAPPTLQNFFRLICSLIWFTRSFWMFYSIWFYVNDVWDFYSFWLLSNYFWSFNQFFGFDFQKWFIVFFSIISIRDFFINLVGSNNKSFFFWCFIEQLLFFFSKSYAFVIIFKYILFEFFSCFFITLSIFKMNNHYILEKQKSERKKSVSHKWMNSIENGDGK